MRAKKPLTNTAAAVPTAPATLADKRAEWLECLHGDDDNSIRRQFENLLWDLLSWSTINGARRWAPHDETGKVKGFALLHGLLDRCFATTVMAGVRRLCDPSNTIDNPGRGVWSLVSLLRDMTEHAGLFTREAIFRADRIPFDLGTLHAEARGGTRESVSTGAAQGTSENRASAPIRESASRDRDEQVDLLAGVARGTRSQDDQVRPEVFEQLKKRVTTTCEQTRKKVNKFLAHAANPQSRSTLVDKSSSVTPADLFKTVMVCKDTFDFVSEVVLGKGYPLLSAVELVDNLENIECPLINKDDVPHVRRVWNETKARLSGSYGDVEDFLKGLTCRSSPEGADSASAWAGQ